MKNLTVLEAIKGLASVCDGARSKDGHGFNAADTFLKQYSACSMLTLQEQAEYQQILFKYKGQLGIDSMEDLTIVDYGKSNKEITAKQTEEIIDWQIKKINKSATVVNGELVISFGYHSELVKRVKQLQGAKFNWNTKEWVVAINGNQQDLENFLSTNYFNEVDFTEVKDKVVEAVNPTRVEFNEAKSIMTFHFPYDYARVQAVKTIPGRKWNNETKTWSAKLDDKSVVKTSDLLEEYPDFDVPAELTKAIDFNLEIIAEKAKQMAKNSLASRAMDADFEVEGFKGTLMPFQKAGVKYITENKKVLVGDEMGLGKTIEAIASIIKLNAVPAIVVCPNSLKYNWQREFNKFSDYRTEVVNADTDIDSLIGKTDVYVMNYNSVSKFLDKLVEIGAKAIVSDESHYLKNGKAKRTKAFKTLSEQNPEMVLLLSGTAIVNRVSELISPLQILNKLDDFGGFWKFATRYCGAHRTQFGLDMSGSQNLAELHEKLRSLCYIRRNKSEVLTELPEKVRQIIELDINNRSKYNKAEADLIDYLKKEVEVSQDFINSISHLTAEEQKEAKKQWHEEKAKKAEAAEHLVSINELKKLVVEGKMEEAKNWIQDVIDNDEKLVVFATHVKTVDELAKHFKCNKIDGSVSSEDRDKFVQDFQNNENTKLIIVNLAAGKEGLTLTAASKLVFVEQGWTPGEHDQAEDRIHRIGQKNTANIYYLIGRNTIDNDIYELIESKRKVTNSVNKGEHGENNISIMNELISRLVS